MLCAASRSRGVPVHLAGPAAAGSRSRGISTLRPSSTPVGAVPVGLFLTDRRPRACPCLGCSRHLRDTLSCATTTRRGTRRDTSAPSRMPFPTQCVEKKRASGSTCQGLSWNHAVPFRNRSGVVRSDAFHMSRFRNPVDNRIGFGCSGQAMTTEPLGAVVIRREPRRDRYHRRGVPESGCESKPCRRRSVRFGSTRQVPT